MTIILAIIFAAVLVVMYICGIGTLLATYIERRDQKRPTYDKSDGIPPLG